VSINKLDVVVVDYKTGNVDSVLKAISMANKTVELSDKKDVILSAKKIILPGQGSFDYGMEQLLNLDLVNIITEQVTLKKIPVLGICLGMQILADIGYENQKKTKGLGLIKGEVKKIPTNLKLPHVGWNEVLIKKEDRIFSEIEDKKDFYFVHSYYFDCFNQEEVLSTTNYDFNFPSIVGRDNIYGFQFHPEKSLKNGLKLLNNFLKI
jgi:imidazole glycerol-phosphate synthase subunit HisH